MKNLSILILFFCFMIPNLKSQNYTSQDPNYINNVKSGEAALKAEKYDSCMVYYRKGFKVKQTSVLSTLRMAACAYSGGYLHEYKKQKTRSKRTIFFKKKLFKIEFTGKNTNKNNGLLYFNNK